MAHDLDLNDFVRVKLTDTGRRILRERHIADGERHEYSDPVVDENGYWETQMWLLMSIFGEHISTAQELPFLPFISIPLTNEMNGPEEH